MKETEQLVFLFNEAVKQTVAEAKSNATSYADALEWIDVHVNVSRRPTDEELQSTQAMLTRQFIRSVNGEACLELKKEAMQLPLVKTD
jgi:hypothetical protein